MILTMSAVVLALAVSGVPATQNPTLSVSRTTRPETVVVQPIRTAIAQAAPVERWQRDTPQARPAALPVMYATLAALQVADVYSTRQALGATAYEANPLMRNASKHAGAMLAVKALSTVGTIYFAERAWKKNRVGALVLMAAINGVTAAVTARNLRNAR